MTSFTVHVREGRPVVLVAERFSLWAMLLGPVWLVFVGAWIPAVLLACAWAAAVMLVPSAALGPVALGLAFAVQAAVGWVLDLWPRTDSGGWDPDGYSWALGMTVALQAVAALVMVTALRRRP